MNYLIDHAVRNVWCTPDQDNQYIIKPRRLNGNIGSKNTVSIASRSKQLPTTNTIYYVYQVGNLFPHLLGMYSNKPYETWFKLSEVCKDNKCIINVYDINGVNYPLHECYYMMSEERNLVIAIKHKVKIPMKLTNDIFIRFYSNSYFDSNRSSILDNKIIVDGMTIVSPTDLFNFNIKVNTYKAIKDIGVTCYLNGLVVKEFTPLNTLIGDVVEFVYDSSIIDCVDLKVSDLETFHSRLDNISKYFVHWQGTYDPTIKYFDDNDIYVTCPRKDYGYTVAPIEGVYYHRNNISAVRQLTHRDYSVPVTFVRNYSAARTNWNNDDLILKIKIRKSGYHRGLIPDVNKINELYKLPETQLVGAVINHNATLEHWKAATLEESSYIKIMTSKFNQLTSNIVAEGYGYDTVSYLLANTPKKTILRNNVTVIDNTLNILTGGYINYMYDATGVPVSFYRENPEDNFFSMGALPVLAKETILGNVRSVESNSLYKTNDVLVYEFDNNGLLLGYSNNIIVDDYMNCLNASAAYAEVLIGQGNTGFDDHYNVTSLTIPDTLDFRLYKRDITQITNNKHVSVSNIDYYNEYIKNFTSARNNIIREDVYINTQGWEDCTDTQLYKLVHDPITKTKTITWLVNINDNQVFIRTNKYVLTRDYSIQTEGTYEIPLFSTINLNGALVDKPLYIPGGILDVFINNHLGIEGVDYIYKEGKVVIVSKEYIDSSTHSQKIHIRFNGFCESNLKRIRDYCDSGFIRYGQLSKNRYFDMRDFRVIEIAANGRLYTLPDILTAENNLFTNNQDPLNGKPYSIRDVPIALRNTVNSDSYKFRKKSILKNIEIMDYVTLYKPEPPVENLDSIIQLYKQYSPFMSKIIFDMISLHFPEIDITKHYSENYVKSLCVNYEGLLKYDPTQTYNRLDSRFVIIHPHAFNNTVNINVWHYKFLLKVNEIYLDNLVSLNSFIKIS